MSDTHNPDTPEFKAILIAARMMDRVNAKRQATGRKPAKQTIIDRSAEKPPTNNPGTR